MEILYARCAGWDIHKETVAACALTPGTGAEPNREIEEFGTTTAELRRLLAWLRERGVTHAAMESTGVYWKPVFNILESACPLILLNDGTSSRFPAGGLRLDRIVAAAWIAGSQFRA